MRCIVRDFEILVEMAHVWTAPGQTTSIVKMIPITTTTTTTTPPLPLPGPPSQHNPLGMLESASNYISGPKFRLGPRTQRTRTPQLVGEPRHR